MKIIWITTLFPSSPQDIKGMFIYRTVKALSKQYDLTVMCLYPVSPPLIQMLKNLRNALKLYKLWRDKYPKHPQSPKDLDVKVIYVKYFRLPRGSFQFTEGSLAYFFSKKHFKKLITKNTVIHASWIFPDGDLARIIHNKYGVPFIVTLRGSDVEYLKVNSRNWQRTKEMIEAAEFLTSVSNTLYTTLESKEIIIPENKKALIHTIYDFEGFAIQDKVVWRKKYDININSKIIFFAGNFRKLKNVNLIIEALHKLRREFPQLYLYLAGTGEEESALRQLVKNYRLNSHVIFLGALKGNEIVNYYNVADVLCLPSDSEGTPNVVIESLLCGTPVVASAVGEIPYIIKDDTNGYTVQPKSVDALITSLRKALNKEWDRETLRTSVTRFSPDNVITEYHSVFNSINKKIIKPY